MLSKRRKRQLAQRLLFNDDFKVKSDSQIKAVDMLNELHGQTDLNTLFSFVYYNEGASMDRVILYALEVILEWED